VTHLRHRRKTIFLRYDENGTKTGPILVVDLQRVCKGGRKERTNERASVRAYERARERASERV
jgi:hypothetical protein